ncbi:nuclear transport factor 2 family protein (plasmid) [Streptomyces sp. NBC_01005]|uniref:nuclear transport factor 2 family protein n=1 Tax=unclassified Streptomyces TaxID=2593676 RepID=UPI002E36089E|nr:nuclear transport factor 2 family protein [Streptomyces sp. NBC_01362]WSW11093.1 nuclear transport factor 2 family protein [Streptomyces sp. NBC_01005]WTD00601.1 nuclear transport factor 2 family protein [Streptomyces sp. NBC_01650]
MPHVDTPAVRTPREVLNRYYQAMLEKSADDLADLYALDAVHEFPFTSTGFPPRYEGREAVRAGYRAAWGASPVQVQEVRKVAAYETADPEVIIAEHVVVGTLPTGHTDFTVPGLLILHVHSGLITRARDYMDSLGVPSARG